MSEDQAKRAAATETTHDHIVSSFDDDIVEIKNQLSRMGSEVELQLMSCMEAIAEHRALPRETIKAREKDINALHDDVDQRALRLFARRQPMAKDLRANVGAMKMAAELERMGDLAKTIGYRSADLAEFPPLDITPRVKALADVVVAQVRSAMTAFDDGDVGLAVEAWKDDDKVDDLYTALVREVLLAMTESNESVDPGVHVLFVVKNLERIGDHVTNLAEIIHFTESGQQLETSI